MEIFGWLISTHAGSIHPSSSIPADLKDYLQRETNNIINGHNVNHFTNTKLLKNDEERELQKDPSSSSNRSLKNFYRHYINISKPDWIFEKHSKDLNLTLFSTPQHLNITTHSRNYILTDITFQIQEISNQDDSSADHGKPIHPLNHLNYSPHTPFNTLFNHNDTHPTNDSLPSSCQNITPSRQLQPYVIEFTLVVFVIQFLNHLKWPYSKIFKFTISQYMMFVCFCVLAFSESTNAIHINLRRPLDPFASSEYGIILEKIFCTIIKLITILIGAFSLTATTLAMSKIQQLYYQLDVFQ